MNELYTIGLHTVPHNGSDMVIKCIICLYIVNFYIGIKAMAALMNKQQI